MSLPQTSGDDHRGGLNPATPAFPKATSVYCGFLRTKVDVMPLRIHGVCTQIPGPQVSTLLKTPGDSIRNHPSPSLRAENSHHHLEIIPGLESDAIKSEKQDFPEEGKGKRQKGKVFPMETEGTKALPLHRRQTTHAVSTKWRSERVSSDV